MNKIFDMKDNVAPAAPIISNPLEFEERDDGEETDDEAIDSMTVSSMNKIAEENEALIEKAERDQREQRDAEARRKKAEAESKKRAETMDKQITKNMKEMSAAQKADQKKREMDEEQAQKKKVQIMINKYLVLNPTLMKYIPKPTERMSLVELQEILQTIREVNNSKGAEKMVKKYISLGLTAVETVVGDGSSLTFIQNPDARPNLKGMVNLLNQGAFDTDLQPLISELLIEYPWLGAQTLLIRSVTTIMTVMMATSIMNKDPAMKALLEANLKSRMEQTLNSLAPSTKPPPSSSTPI